MPTSHTKSGKLYEGNFLVIIIYRLTFVKIISEQTFFPIIYGKEYADSYCLLGKGYSLILFFTNRYNGNIF